MGRGTRVGLWGVGVLLWSVAGCAASVPNDARDATPRAPEPDASPTPVVPERARPEAPRLSLGAQHACYVSKDGEVWCWGLNRTAQLGDGTIENRSVPTRVTVLDHALDVAAGSMQTCAILPDRTVGCWGGRSATPSLTRIDDVVDARSISVGFMHACAVLGSGRVRCWGENALGQLGDGTTTAHLTQSVEVRGLDDATGVAVGSTSSCAVRVDGSVACWGSSSGNKKLMPAGAENVDGLPPLRTIAMSNRQACGVSRDRAVYCWGSDIGNEGGADPEPVRGMEDVDGFALSGMVKCAWKGAKVSCLGNLRGFSGATSAPREIEGFSLGAGPIRASVGQGTLCAMGSNGVQCVGDNIYGQLGIGELPVVPDPHAVAGTEQTVRVLPFSSAGCALGSTGRVSCWGYGTTGIPTGATPERTEAMNAKPIDGIEGATSLMYGSMDGEACASVAAGRLLCFQAGLYANPSELATKGAAYVPRRVLGLDNVVATVRYPSGGGALAIHENGTVTAFKAKDTWTTPSGEIVRRVDTVRVGGLTNVAAIAMSPRFGCALDKKGMVACWPLSVSFSPDGVREPASTRPRLQPIVGLSDIVDLTATFTGLIARKNDGTTWRSQLDLVNGSLQLKAPPMIEPTLTGASAMTHAGPLCAAVGGGLACDQDRNGRMTPGGDGRGLFRREVGPVSSIEYHGNTCLVRQDRTVACWGVNRGQALGAPDRELSTTPAAVRLKGT